MENIVSIKNLHVSFRTYHGVVQAVSGVSLEVHQNEILALVGESGCGKTVTAQSILRLNDSNYAITQADELKLGELDVCQASEKQMDQVRGTVAGMIFQNPMTSLNPTMKVGKQITEHVYKIKQMTAKQREAEAIRLLNLVCIDDAPLRAQQYPHQFSGGMRQRIMIAMALACNPSLLIADEPTTALDVTIQLQILKLLYHIQQETKTSILLITHDFGVVANLADRVAVMVGGKIVEQASVEELLNNPIHPYTKGLLESLPLPEGKGKLKSIKGTSPNLFLEQKGCAFANRCHLCMKLCLRKQPPMIEVLNQHTVACWNVVQDNLKGESR